MVYFFFECFEGKKGEHKVRSQAEQGARAVAKNALKINEIHVFFF
jgi:hypothetical protein